MTEHNWAKLMKQQDEFVHQQDRKQRERRLRMKEIYRNELQKMINYNYEHQRDEKDSDRRLVKWLNQKQQRRLLLEKEQLLHKHKMKQSVAKDNLKSIEKRRSIIQQQLEQEKKIFNSRNKKTLTEIQEQLHSRLRQRQEEKEQLARVYDEQIKFSENKRTMEKMEDEKFSKLMDQIQRKKQQSRREFLERLRNGYRQNPQVYEQSVAIYKQKQKQRTQFLRKILDNQTSQPGYENKYKELQTKSNKAKETSNFNKNYFETKSVRNKFQSLQQISQYNKKYESLQNQLKEEKLKQMREREEKKRKLKTQLDRQIDESHVKQIESKKMNEQEYRMNRSGGHIANLPGLSKDFAAEKQQRIVQNFLKSGGSLKCIDR